MDSRRIVETLYEHDPVFAAFTEEVLKADSPQEAWELLYGPEGISKMSPDASEIHIPVPTHGKLGVFGRLIPSDKRRIKRARVEKGLVPTKAVGAVQNFAGELPGGRIRPLTIGVVGGTTAATAFGAYKAKKYLGEKNRGYKQFKGVRPPTDTRAHPVFGKSEFNIAKVDEDKHQVFGWASVIEKDGQPVLDKQGDIISADEMEKSAYRFVLDSRKGGRQHKRTEDDQVLHVSDMIESMAMTRDKIEKMGLPPETPVGWWVGFKVNDEETWQDVKNGKVTSFSIHGRGKRLPVE